MPQACSPFAEGRPCPHPTPQAVATDCSALTATCSPGARRTRCGGSSHAPSFFHDAGHLRLSTGGIPGTEPHDNGHLRRAASWSSGAAQAIDCRCASGGSGPRAGHLRGASAVRAGPRPLPRQPHHPRRENLAARPTRARSPGRDPVHTAARCLEPGGVHAAALARHPGPPHRDRGESPLRTQATWRLCILTPARHPRRLYRRGWPEGDARPRAHPQLTTPPRAREPVSSSRMRRLLLLGQVRAAAQLLGRDYFLRSTVEHGLKRGRELGFPTANLRVSPNKLLPATGIYAVRVDLEDRLYAGALSIGFRPTFGSNSLTVEVFILDFDRPVYDKLLTVWFVQRLWAEKRFASVPTLVEQMARGRSEE